MGLVDKVMFSRQRDYWTSSSGGDKSGLVDNSRSVPDHVQTVKGRGASSDFT